MLRQAAELQPPIALRRAAVPTRAKPAGISREDDAVGGITLVVEAEELSRWARRCAEERLKARRTSNLAVAASAHNMAWTLALIAWAGAPL